VESNDEKEKEKEQRIYEITEEIKGLLNPHNYESTSNNESTKKEVESNENGLLKLKYYYIYGNIKDYNSDNAKIIDLSYHSFVKINKRLHSIMDKTYHDLTDDQDGANIVHPSDKDYFALGFYHDPNINNLEDYVRLDLFFYNSFSYYDIFGLDDFFGEL
jgi:hypothetical protein